MGMMINTFWAAAGENDVPDRYANSSSQNLTTSLANVTGLTFSISANATVYFHGVLFTTAGSNSPTVSISINGPSSPSSVAMSASADNPNSGAGGTITTYESLITASSNNTNALVAFSGKIVNGVNAGTVAIRAKTNSTDSPVAAVRGDAWMLVWTA